MKLCKCGCLRKLSGGDNSSRWFHPYCAEERKRARQRKSKATVRYEQDNNAAEIERTFAAHLAFVRASRMFTVGDGWDQRGNRLLELAPGPMDMPTNKDR